MEQYDLSILWKYFEAEFDGSSQVSVNAWIICLAKGGGQKKRVSMLLEPSLFQTIPLFQSNSGTFRK